MIGCQINNDSNFAFKDIFDKTALTNRINIYF